MSPPLVLISHPLCPYVQRAVIALGEKRVPFERRDIDLAAKPEWFLRLSPLGKTPLLLVGERTIFESAVILEYLEETQPRPLHPADPLTRAEHRAWIEFGSAVLNGIAGFYNAPDAAVLRTRAGALADQFARLEAALADRPATHDDTRAAYFDGRRFSLVDAAFGPVFRYFDTFEQIGDFGILDRKPRVAAWRRALARRPSVSGAVAVDYPQRLQAFLAARGSHLSRLLTAPAA